MNIFGIGLPEMILILVVALLIFGPKKLPEIGSSLGKALRGFQDATKDFENEFKREVKKLEEEKPAASDSVAVVSEGTKNPEENNSKTEIS